MEEINWESFAVDFWKQLETFFTCKKFCPELLHFLTESSAKKLIDDLESNSNITLRSLLQVRSITYLNFFTLLKSFFKVYEIKQC